MTLQTEIYRLDTKGYYRLRGGYRRYPGSHGYLHRVVWMEAHGSIPKGYDVHHRDDDRQNCVLENLELISRSGHMSHHKYRRPNTSAQQSVAALARWQKRVPTEHSCEWCGKMYLSRATNSRFCEDFCRRQARDAS